MCNINLILAVGPNNEIGLNDGLPWESKEDLKHFKTITKNHCVLMGFNTYKSIGRPLPERTNIIISSEKKDINGCVNFQSVEDGIEFAKARGESELFIIGGASIYKYCAEKNLIDIIYLSKMIY